MSLQLNQSKQEKAALERAIDEQRIANRKLFEQVEKLSNSKMPMYVAENDHEEEIAKLRDTITELQQDLATKNALLAEQSSSKSALF
jgi:hypothetical protein